MTYMEPSVFLSHRIEIRMMQDGIKEATRVPPIQLQ